MQDNPGDELNLVEDDHRHCKKNSPSILSYRGKIRSLWQRSAPLRNPMESGKRESYEKDLISKIAGMPYLCNDWSQWVGTWANGSCSGFGERACQFIPETSRVTRNLRATWEEREPERSQIIPVGETPEP